MSQSDAIISTEELPATVEGTRQRILIDWPSALFSFWLLGVVTLLLTVVYRSLKLKRDIAAAKVLEDPTVLQIVEEGAKALRIKPPLLKVSHKFRSPLACGILHPTLVFPEHIIEKFSQSELRAIINHELAHIKRMDILTNWFQIITQICYFFNPLIWYVNRQIRLEREQSCDDWVLQIGKEDRKTYVDALVKVVELCSKRRGFALGIVGVSEPFTLMARRLKMIMDSGRRISTKLSASGIIGLVVIGLVGIPSCGVMKKSGTELESVTEAYDHQASLINNIMIEVKAYYKPLSSIEKIRENSRFKLIREGDKKLIEETGVSAIDPETGKETEGGYFVKVLYDRKTGKIVEYTESPSSHKIFRDGIIDFLDDKYERFRFQDIVGEIRIGDKRLLDLLQHKNAKVVSTAEKLDNASCWLVKGYYEGSPKLEYEVWVDPEIGFMPRFAKIGRRDIFSFEMKFVNYKEIHPQVWFPMCLENKFISPTPQTMELSPEATITIPAITYHSYIVTSAIVNAELPSEIFKITFPSGTEVSDRIVGIHYTVP